jgi:hypothetical protein
LLTCFNQSLTYLAIAKTGLETVQRAYYVVVEQICTRQRRKPNRVPPLRWQLLIILLLATNLLALAQSRPYLDSDLSRLPDLMAKLSSYSQTWEAHRKPLTPLFQPDDETLLVRAGDYRAVHFAVIDSNATSLELLSEQMQGPDGSLPLRTRITYRLRKNRLRIFYQFEATGQVELTRGLEISITSSKLKAITTRNHFGEQTPIICQDRNHNYHHALQQVYELCNDRCRMVLLFPNPFQSFVTIEERAPVLFFHWYVLPASALVKARKPSGPGFASVLSKGQTLQRELELIIFNQNDPPAPTFPLAYFSPFPEGYDQVITIGLDDIPFHRWCIARSSHDPQSPVQSELVHLLDNHPKMKMSWLVVPDAISDNAELADPAYPAGQWWQAHSVHRILTAAPEPYKQWLRDLDLHQKVLGYEDRISLGNHGLHHSPEQAYGLNWEFQNFDPALCDSTLCAIVREHDLLGLSPNSRRWIRFPGFMFSRATVDALIKYRFTLFDYDKGAIGRPWMLTLAPLGQIWGLQVQWEGDTPQPFSVMDEALSRGAVCHCAGHPGVWFKNGDPSAFAALDALFSRAEEKYDHLGYLWPDELAQFAEETYQLHYHYSEFTSQEYLFSFSGKTNGQSLYIEWPVTLETPQFAVVDGQILATPLQKRSRRLICTLPLLPAGLHIIRVPYRSPSFDLPMTQIQVAASADRMLFQSYPNPFNETAKIRFQLSDSLGSVPVDLTLYNEAGRAVRRLYHQPAHGGIHELRWDGLDDNFHPVAAGIYFCRLVTPRSAATLKLIHLP